MGLKDIFANKKLAKIRKMEEDTKRISKSIFLGDSARTEEMKNHFTKEVAALESYAKAVEDLFEYIKSNPEVVYMLKDIDILPPFVVFPWLAPDSEEWEQDISKSYANVFKRMMNQKSPNEILEYCQKNPFPKWWYSSTPCKAVMYQEFWDIELAETGYDDHWRHALCEKYREQFCVKYHREECDGTNLEE